MELIKFTPGTNPTEVENGVVVEGYDDLTWVERYRKNGEFKLRAPMSSGLLDSLPLNTFVTLDNSLDLMLVENHILKEKKGEDAEIEISGRGFDAWLENRIVGMEQYLNNPTAPLAELFLAAADSWDQVVTLINTHIDWDTIPVNKEDSLPGVIAVADQPGTLTGITPTNERRVLKRGSVHKRVLEILEVDDLGVRVLRRNPFGELGDPDDTWFLIHAGNNRSDSIIFSQLAGDLDSAEYLWSSKTEKNSALVTGKHFEINVLTSDWNFDRRSTIVDGRDIDDIYTDAPTGTEKTNVLQGMFARGNEELSAHRRYVLTRADISEGAQFSYPDDYDIGDIVSVDGSYGDIVPMRVIEYTRILDETGASGHPTLEALYT